MQKRAGLLTVFSLFIILSLVVFFLFRQQTFPLGVILFESVSFPIQRSLYTTFAGIIPQTEEAEKLREENRKLTNKIVDQQDLVRETKALRDQYDLEVVSSKELLPATVIGMKSFIPGVSLPEEIIIDKGKNQNVKKGQTVILTNNVVGNIAEVSDNRSLVSLISNKKQSLTGETVDSGAVGVIRGKGNGVIAMENVVLSDKLRKGDIVITKGEETLEGSGYPPGLVIGKITSVDKKASDLFQTAEVESLITFISLKKVFVITGEE